MQVPWLHCIGRKQAWQVLPLAPHAATSVPGWQAPVLSQQPLHVDGPQGCGLLPHATPTSAPTRTARTKAAEGEPG